MGVLAVIDHVNIHNVESSLVQTRLIGLIRFKQLMTTFNAQKAMLGMNLKMIITI